MAIGQRAVGGMMQFKPLAIAGAYEIVPEPRADERGYFLRTYDAALFEQHGLHRQWVQENQSLSRNLYTIRGLHMQRTPHSETKLVRVVRGEIWDVFVDLRRNSPTFGRWEAVPLSAAKHNMAYIPAGCAHGFCSLAPDTLVMYKVDAAYAPQAELVLHYAAPELAIPWPVPVGGTVTLSDKDRNAPGWAQLKY